MESVSQLSIESIRRFLPHRAPFLLVDRVLSVIPQGELADLGTSKVCGTKVTALKNFTYNEPFVPGHFPEYSIIPGVILLETLAQAASFAMYPFVKADPHSDQQKMECILIGVDGARFRKPVIPGDQLTIEAEVIKARGRFWTFLAKGLVDGNVVVEAEMLASVSVKREKEGT